MRVWQTAILMGAPLALSVAASAAAQEIYIEGFAGVSVYNDADLTSAGGTATDVFDAGFLLGGAVGLDFDGIGRVEGQVAYRSASSDEFEGGGASFPQDADTSVVSLMVNYWYDIQLDNGITPFFGGGIGVGFVDYEANLPPPVPVSLSDDATGFAFQLGGGLAFELDTNVEAFIRYTYFSVPSLDLDFGASGSADYEHDSHNFDAGIRILLN